MSQEQQPPQAALPQHVIGDIMGRVSVGKARQVSKLTRQGSPDYTYLLKQRGYTDEFLVELLDAVELIEPGLLEVLKAFYDFRKTHKTTEAILKEHFNVFKNNITSVKRVPNNILRFHFIKYYYLFKVLYIATIQKITNKEIETDVLTNRDNRIELDSILHHYLFQKEQVENARNSFNLMGKNNYYFSTIFVESINTLFRDLIGLYNTVIEKYREAIHSFDARKAAEAEAKKERAATKRLIASVNKKAAAKERAVAAASAPVAPVAPASPTAEVAESSRAARARRRNASRS